MDGDISVESEYEKGSTFYVSLPQKIIDPAPSIPVPDSNLKAALGIRYADLEMQGSLENVKDGYIIVEKHLLRVMNDALLIDDAVDKMGKMHFPRQAKINPRD